MKADLFLRGGPDYLHEDWLQKSLPIHMENVVLGQAIIERKAAYFNLLNNFNVGTTLTVVYLISFLGILAFCLLINYLTVRIQFGHRRKIQKIPERIALIVRSFGVRRVSAIGVFVLFAHLFLWATQLFFTNSIKTNKVVS